MKDYIFEVVLADGKVLHVIRTAATRFIAEMILSNDYPEAASINYITIKV